MPILRDSSFQLVTIEVAYIDDPSQKRVINRRDFDSTIHRLWKPVLEDPVAQEDKREETVAEEPQESPPMKRRGRPPRAKEPESASPPVSSDSPPLTDPAEGAENA